MVLAILNRIRFVGGIRKISIDAILPIVLLPIMFSIAAINFYLLITICIVMPLFLGYAQWLRKSFAPNTKFFFMWTLWSGIYLWILFEMTVPLMELLPEENFIFITTLFGAAFCFYKVNLKRYVISYTQQQKKCQSNDCFLINLIVVISIDTAKSSG